MSSTKKTSLFLEKEEVGRVERKCAEVGGEVRVNLRSASTPATSSLVCEMARLLSREKVAAREMQTFFFCLVLFLVCIVHVAICIVILDVGGRN